MVALLVVLAVVGAVSVRRTWSERADDRDRQEGYAAVLAAADAEATAFVNLRYDRAAQSIDAVVAGATGDFRSHYVSSARRLVREMQRHRSTLTGHAVWSGVTQLDRDHATVIVATTGTAANNSTGGRKVPRHYRLRLTLLRDGGRWLTSDIAFVGGSS
jgi:Mce-associated membrane protein